MIVDGHAAPYWRSPAYAGYYGSSSSSLDQLLAMPLGAAMAGAVVDDVVASLLDAFIDVVNPFS